MVTASAMEDGFVIAGSKSTFAEPFVTVSTLTPATDSSARVTFIEQCPHDIPDTSRVSVFMFATERGKMGEIPHPRILHTPRVYVNTLLVTARGKRESQSDHGRPITGTLHGGGLQEPRDLARAVAVDVTLDAEPAPDSDRRRKR